MLTRKLSLSNENVSRDVILCYKSNATAWCNFLVSFRFNETAFSLTFTDVIDFCQLGLKTI